MRPTTLNLTNIILHHSKANGDNQLYDSSTRHKNNKKLEGLNSPQVTKLLNI